MSSSLPPGFVLDPIEPKQQPGQLPPGFVLDPVEPQAPVEEPGFLQRAGRFVSGIPGAAPTLATAFPAQVAGGISGLGAAVLSGGDLEAAEAVRRGVEERLTIDPVGRRAEETLQKTAQAIQPIVEPVAKAVDIAGETVAEVTGVPELGALTETALIAGPEILGARFGIKKAPAIQKALQETELPSLRKAELGLKRQDLGAAATPKELQRATTAQAMPVPFEGESALTKGQVTRNFEQLQFEKETAKKVDLGESLRERVENQSETLIQNFDAIEDMQQPIRSEYRDIGQAVDEALKQRHKKLKKIENNLYEQARSAGELKENISIDELTDTFEDIDRFRGVSNNVGPIINEAKRLKLVDQDLNVIPQSLDDIELYRQFVNNATDITDPRQARIRRIVLSTIDDATEKAGGNLYKKARKHSRKMRQEFENTGITKRLLSSKKGSDERAIAYEDVFKKIILDSPIEEVNKLRGTLLKGGDTGKQAWADLKAKGISYIKENAFSASQMDARGNPLLSPDKINKVIKSLDRGNKLEKIYGKKGAQTIRDLGELSNVIYTAPPGAINFSNTTSALINALDYAGGYAITGLPVPAVQALKKATGFIKEEKIKRKVKESLNYLDALNRRRSGD